MQAALWGCSLLINMPHCGVMSLMLMLVKGLSHPGHGISESYMKASFLRRFISHCEHFSIIALAFSSRHCCAVGDWGWRC